MFFALSKILDVFLSPLTWAIGLCLVAAFRRTESYSRLLPFLAAFVLFFFAVEPVSNRLARAVEEKATKTMRDGVTYDVVVLLGGLVDHRATATSNQPSYNDSVERLLTTFDLLRTGRARNAILSGGADEDGDPIVEATLLSRQLETWGIAKERLVTEGASRNTLENAAFTAKLIKERRFGTVLIVTSAGHVPRALAAFEAEGVAADVVPVDFRSYDPERGHEKWLPRTGALSVSTAALRELAGRAAYSLLGVGRR